VELLGSLPVVLLVGVVLLQLLAVGYSAVLAENAKEAIPVLERSLTLVEGLGDTRGSPGC